MHTNIIITIAIITSVLMGYQLMVNGDLPELGEIENSEQPKEYNLEVKKKIDMLTDVIENYRKINQEQIRQAQLEQTKLKNKLAELDARLSSYEADTTEQSINYYEPYSDKKITNFDLTVNSDINSESKKISEVDLGNWIDETFDAGNWDWNLTAKAAQQATASLENVPGVKLENIKCGDRFCRATLAHDIRNQPDISRVIGQPPFVNGGFSIDEPDGRVSLYFTSNGITLEDLRSYAQNAAQ